MISRAADRALDRLARGAPRRPLAVDPEVAAFHAALPVVDLLVGSLLFRPDFLRPIGHGHVDLERARAGGLDLIGLSIATRYPDLRGRLSGPHFRSLGIRPRGPGDLAIVEAFIRRSESWASGSGGRLVVARSPADLRPLQQRSSSAGDPDAPLRAFIGVQGGQALDGDLRSVERLARLGVRMVGLAHVMDSPLAGSGTGRVGDGLSGFGREAIAELERVGVLVDLAHASPAAIREAVPRLRRPFLVSHTGFRTLAGHRSRWRRYSPATRNLSDDDVRLVGQAGGLIGVSLAAPLVGGASLAAVVRAFDHAVALVGPERVALGSDFDGALPMPFDATGLPALSAALLAAGFGRDIVAAILGGNALRLLGPQ
ncbi:MAG: dipeptidase [Candidatus Limnocylindrales bacterium]